MSGAWPQWMPFRRVRPKLRVMTLVLVKFLTEETYLRDLLDGKIYANRLSCFKKIEESDDTGRGDRHEDVVAWYQPDRGVLKLDGVDIMPFIDRPIEFHSKQLDHLNLFCTTYGSVKDEVLNGLADDGSEELSNTLVVSGDLRSMGHNAVVITDIGEFIRRMKEAAGERGFVIGHRPVDYYDPDSYHGAMSLAEALFQKQDRYRYQNEFRFVIHTQHPGREPVILEIGDIRDIAFGVRTAESDER